jgi:hypothetical protein
MALLDLYKFHTSPEILPYYDKRKLIFNDDDKNKIIQYVDIWLGNFLDDVHTYDNDGSTKGILSQFLLDEEFELGDVIDGDDRIFTIEIQNVTVGHILFNRDSMIVSADTGYYKNLKYTDVTFIGREVPMIDNILNELFDDIAKSI